MLVNFQRASTAVFFQEGPGILAKDFHETGVPLIRLKGVEGDFVTLDGCNFLDPLKVSEKWNHFRLDVGDLVISTSASFGRVSEVTEEAAGAIPYTGLIRFRPRMAGLERSYLRSFLSSAAFMKQVEAMASGSVIRHFGPMHLKQMALHLPPIEVQRSIGDLSDVIADRLRLLRQTNATLEAIAQALFKSWFVDFDPVRAKAEGREPEGMDAATAALFPSTFANSGRRTVPEGWKFVEAGNLFDVGIGKTPPRKEAHWFSVEPTDMPWVSIRDMGSPGVFIGKTSEYLTEEAVSRFNVRRVSAGTVLLSFKLTVGRIAIADYEVTTNEAIAHFRANRDSLPQSYLYCYLKSFDMSSLGSTSSIATATNSRAIRALPVLHPGHELATSFSQHASPLLERIRVQQHHIDSLTELRNTLLPRLISGKLRLPEAEEAGEDALE
ncbi:restriction endonuclease subunit S [bacterium BD-1]|nr:restriction endonuclease subunit S [Ottowia caeni]